MAGRPKFQITAEILKQVEGLAAQGLSQEQVGLVLGISPDTVGRRKKDNADFAAALKTGKAKGIAKVSNKLFEKAVDGDSVAMLFYLKTQAGWRETERLEVSGPGGGPIETIDASRLSTAVLKELIDARAKSSTD